MPTTALDFFFVSVMAHGQAPAMDAGCGRIDTVHSSGWPQHCYLTVEVAAVDDMPGTHGTLPHDAMCFAKTLTFRVSDGLAGPERPS